MPRKYRMRKVRTAALPSPAWVFELLTGQDPHGRLPGWPAQFQQHLGEPDADQIWSQHRDALIAEAAAHGFEPYRLTRRTPTGERFSEWRASFLAAHGY